MRSCVRKPAIHHTDTDTHKRTYTHSTHTQTELLAKTILLHSTHTHSCVLKLVSSTINTHTLAHRLICVTVSVQVCMEIAGFRWQRLIYIVY